MENLNPQWKSLHAKIYFTEVTPEISTSHVSKVQESAKVDLVCTFVILAGIAIIGYFAYDYWKNKQQENSEDDFN